MRAQLRDGEAVYDYGGADGLREAVLSGSRLGAFTVEQQAEMARDYYLRHRLGMDVGAWAAILGEMAAN